MSSSLAGPVVNLITSRSADVDTDVLFLPVFEGEDPGELLDGMNEGGVEAIRRAITTKEFQAKPYELFILPVGAGWRAARVALIGCGRFEEAGMERLRRVASAAALSARQRRFARAGQRDRLGAGDHRGTRAGELQRRPLQER